MFFCCYLHLCDKFTEKVLWYCIKFSFLLARLVQIFKWVFIKFYIASRLRCDFDTKFASLYIYIYNIPINWGWGVLLVTGIKVSCVGYTMHALLCEYLNSSYFLKGNNLLRSWFIGAATVLTNIIISRNRQNVTCFHSSLWQRILSLDNCHLILGSCLLVSESL